MTTKYASSKVALTCASVLAFAGIAAYASTQHPFDAPAAVQIAPFAPAAAGASIAQPAAQDSAPTPEPLFTSAPVTRTRGS